MERRREGEEVHNESREEESPRYLALALSLEALVSRDDRGGFIAALGRSAIIEGIARLRGLQ